MEMMEAIAMLRQAKAAESEAALYAAACAVLDCWDDAASRPLGMPGGYSTVTFVAKYDHEGP